MPPDDLSRLSYSPELEWAASFPYVSLLVAYPHPAFILRVFTGLEKDQRLQLLYANKRFNSVFQDTLGAEPADFIASLRDKQEEFRLWMSNDEPTMALEVERTTSTFSLDITKTRMDNVWVCTTTVHANASPKSCPILSAKVQPPKPSVLSRCDDNPPSRSETIDRSISIREIMANFDWEATSLGPAERWPSCFKSILETVLTSPYPSGIGWGGEVRTFYNDAFIRIAGPKHPHIWGQPGKVAYGEIWEVSEPSIRAVMNGGIIDRQDDFFLLEKMTDERLPEESYFTWSYVPIRQEDGTIGGFLNNSFETTGKVIAKRRMDCLHDIITSSISVTSLGDFSNSVLGVLSNDVNSPDVQFAALYFCTTSSNTTNDSSSHTNTISITLNLSGTIGIPDGHPSTPVFTSVLIHSEEGLAPVATRPVQSWPFLEAIQTQKVIHIKSLDESLVSGFETRGWGDRPREAVVIPIGISDYKIPNAILILGLNTRRPFDSVYSSDIDMIRMTLGSTLHSTLNREAEVKRAQQLAELDAAKTTLFSNVSHELRTPLTLIGGPLADCIDQVPEGAVKQYLEMAQRNVHRLKRLVDSLMDFSKLAANRLEGQFRPVKLGLLTADLASLFRNPVEKGGLVYRIECDDSPTQPFCYIDPELWEKIVFNLIGNAFKFTMTGSITVRVSYGTNNALFTVKDTGVGIPKDDIPKIFQRFHRVQSTSRSHEGTGIGLALTKELVALHGGSLDIDSENDPNGEHGTTFTVTIPIGKDHLPKANISDEVLVAIPHGTYARGFIDETLSWTDPSPSSSGSSEPLPSPKNTDRGQFDQPTVFFAKSDVVLLVEDNADMRRYIRSILSRYCTVVEAKNGQDALDLAISVKPNLVLSDIMMPGVDGYTLLKELRKRKETNLIPVIFLTARSGDDSQVEGLLSGADDYLAKPFKNAELVARVHLQMQLGKKRVEMEEKFSERLLEIKQLTELSPVGIIRADHLGKIVYVNPRCCEITGFSSTTCTCEQWTDSIHTEDKDMVLDWWRSACENQSSNVLTRSIEFRWHDDTWCKGQCVSLEGRGALAAFTDISSQKNLEAIRLSHAIEKENEARRRAEEAEARRREAEERRRDQELLIDVTSHELRQPVSAILNCSSLVRTNLSALYEELASSNGSFCPSTTLLQTINEDLDALDAVYQCGLVQERIANDVLSLSRIQLDGLSIQPTDFNLVEEVQRIMALFKNEVRMKHIQLDGKFGHSLEQLKVQYVSSDKARFAQIITNLLSNAIKFTDTSTKRREISVSVDINLEPPTDGSCKPPSSSLLSSRQAVNPNSPLYIFVSVTDSGPGLEPADLALLFKRFQQGSNSHNVFGGSGLGLFVSKQLCTLMGGQIEVSSTPGQGATFRFFIQAVAPALNSVGSTSSSPAVGSFEPATPGPIHILITEDNQINQNLLNRQLRKAGYTTALANDGQGAINELLSSDKPFDAVLMDIEMPVLDGISAVRQIRKLEETGELRRRHRIIALTANAREGQVQNIRQAGMDEVMLKPYRIEELLSKIQPASL